MAMRQMEIQSEGHDLLTSSCSKYIYQAEGRKSISNPALQYILVRPEPAMTQEGMLYFTCISNAIDSR